MQAQAPFQEFAGSDILAEMIRLPGYGITLSRGS
jgi:hypothetical protein